MGNLNNQGPAVPGYGLNGPKNTPAKTYTDAINDVQQGTMRSFGVNNPNTNPAYQYEVVTKSGQVYGFFNSTEHGIGYTNLSTGISTGINGTTMQIYNLGNVNYSGDDN